jgi:hypothetical protein
VQTARERLDQGSHLRGEAGRHLEQVPLGDVRGHEHVFGVGAVQERVEVRAELLLATPARWASAARSGIGCDDTPSGADIDPAEFVSEGARQVAQKDGVAALEGLRVGAVGKGDLHLDDDVASLGLRLGHLLQPQIAGAVEKEGSHGVKTTLRTAPLT